MLLVFNLSKKVESILLISSLNKSCNSLILSRLRSYLLLVLLNSLLLDAGWASSNNLTPHKGVLLFPFLIILKLSSITAHPTDVVPISSPIL